ncbi:MAG: hypothetical protein FWD15_02090 [Alphaproteobacteria bacterium]|nr:hypothetical protein [Alphaproteobacteria bacterium]
MKILLTLLFILFGVDAAATCANPEAYMLAREDVGHSNSNLSCAEIKWAKEYLGRNTATDAEIIAAYGNYRSFVRDVSSLRRAGITPEKAKYLFDGDFVKKDSAGRALIRGGQSDADIISAAVARAREHLQDSMVEYRIHESGTAYIGFIRGVIRRSCFDGVEDSIPVVKKITDPLRAAFGLKRIPEFDRAFPDALRPAGVVSRFFVNAFGEVVGKLSEEKTTGFSFAFLGGGGKYEIFVNGADTPVSGIKWEPWRCSITDPALNAKRSMPCLTCTVFEIVFDAVSKIGFIMYDDFAKIAMWTVSVGFLLWTIFLFFTSAIKQNNPTEFVETFIKRSVWLMIVSVALSVSISDRFNILNFTFRPLTELMAGFTEMTSRAFTDGENWECAYKKKQEAKIKAVDNETLFGDDVKANIMCSIERVSDFVNLNSLVGSYAMRRGLDDAMNLRFNDSFLPGFAIFAVLLIISVSIAVKLNVGIFGMIALVLASIIITPLALSPRMILGLMIIGLYTYLGIMITFYFIESIFAIAVVLMTFPFHLAAYAIDKYKNMAKESLGVFMGAVFQIISLGITCAVIAMLMSLAVNIDPAQYHAAMVSDDAQKQASVIMKIISMEVNDLLKIGYVWLVCWYMLSTMMNNIASGNLKYGVGPFKGKMHKNFITFATSSIKMLTSATREVAYHVSQKDKVNDWLGKESGGIIGGVKKFLKDDGSEKKGEE